MRKPLAIALLCLLAACSTPQGQAAVAALETGRQAVADTVDAKLDLDRDLMCNAISYRAEMAARKRWGVKQETWDDFCGRVVEKGGR